MQANPDVCFIKWADSSKANTFNYAVDIFPDIMTIDENITYGIGHFGTGAITPSMRLESVTNFEANINSINCTVYNSTDTVYSEEFTSDSSDFVAFSPALYPGNYTIWLEIDCKTGASPSNTSTITFEMKETV